MFFVVDIGNGEHKQRNVRYLLICLSELYLVSEFNV